MAEEIQLADNRSFPPPPPFWKQFTEGNVEQFEALKETAAGEGSRTTQHDLDFLHTLQVPDGLREFVPPHPPAEGRYKVFTELQDINAPTRTLEDEGIEQVYPSHAQIIPSTAQPVDTDWTVDRVYYLKKIVQSLMVNFLELIDVLSKDPGAKEDKLEHIVQLYKNAHKLINDYRPHQARETLILMMEDQLEKGRAEVAEIERMKDKFEGIFGSFKEFKEPHAKASSVQGQDLQSKEVEKRKLEQRRAWQALEEEMAT